jgi:DNA-directed RNA polymerase subunit RPC12/RpoP
MVSRFRNRRWLIRSVLAIWFVSSLFAAFLQYQLNGIVNGTLYDYGLRFDDGWALQYWALERLYYVSLYAPSLLGGFALVFDLWRSRVERVPAVKRVEKNVADGKAAPAAQTAARETSMKISCPKCKKLFGTPLNMLDFSSGKAQLVNVCPYCNHVLGDAGHVDMNVRVIEPCEKEEMHQRR